MEGIRLEVQELEIVCPLVPFVLFVVLTRSWKGILLLFVLEPFVSAKLQVRHIFWFVNRIETFVFFVQITSWPDSLWRSLVQLSNSRLFGDSWVSHLVILPREQNEIVCCTSLELLVGERFVVMGLVFSSTRVFVSTCDVD